jgi:hypothetical protein
VIWGSIALFAVLFALLAYRLGAGGDPSLGGATASRPVLVRKIVKRRVVTTVVPGSGPSGVSGAPVATSSVPTVAAALAAPLVTGAS